MTDLNIIQIQKNTFCVNISKCGPSKLLMTILVILLLVVSFSTESIAQRFKGSAVFGLNLAQIDGDNLAGFSKLGLTGGAKLSYPFKDNSDFNLELLFSQRGSNAGFGFGRTSDNYVDLQYLEVPLYINIKDWYMDDEDYHKAKAHAGLNLSYLFAVDSSNGAISNDIDNYQRYNIGYFLGVNYMFTRRVGTTVRYSRALNSITENRAISYWVTVRLEYAF